MSRWTRFRDRLIQKVVDWLKEITGYNEPSVKPEDLEPVPEDKDPVEYAPNDTNADEIIWEQAPFDKFHWDFGGFHGEKAQAVPGCEIDGLCVGYNAMRYRWRKGGCEMLGAAGPDDASCLCCLFVLNSGVWRGGKFDWISTTRTTRSMNNIHGGYRGWSTDVFAHAEAYAFCIVSKNGRKRTNTIIQEGGLQ